MIQIFQSTLPVWGATFDVFCALVYVGFQSTLPVWGATPGQIEASFTSISISIHAPRVGSDPIDSP